MELLSCGCFVGVGLGSRVVGNTPTLLCVWLPCLPAKDGPSVLGGSCDGREKEGC